MNSQIKLDKTRIKIFHEARKRRTFVAELFYDHQNEKYVLTYDKNYTISRNAIPIGPELDLFKLHHYSEKGKLFPSFVDRIPDKDNPAYEDYCKAQKISPTEKNPIILLGTIGKRGPSSFVFEPVYYTEFNSDMIKEFRENLQITQHDFAIAFDISQVTLQKVETEASKDPNTLKRIQIYLTFPNVALWQLKQTGGYIHKDVLAKLIKHFEQDR